MENSLIAFLGVILIDLVLAGDNAVILGALVARLPRDLQRKALLGGTILAIVLRIILSACVFWLLEVPGIRIIGGLLLLYVAWKMFRDLQDDNELDASNEKPATSLWGALSAIAIADVSMSLDNVLGVAATAQGHFEAMAFGLILSIAMMMFAASLVAKLIGKYKWISWVGLALIVFVAGRMLWEGYNEPLFQHLIH